MKKQSRPKDPSGVGQASPFLFDTDLARLDPEIELFSKSEAARQSANLLMIASESLCPRPVREALTTVFTNKYAEGYPSLRMTNYERDRIDKEPERYLAFHRRYGDRRFYKGAEFSNFIEVLAQRRAAEIFANPNAPADQIFVNVQPLSGAAANNAVYNAFVAPGDTIMGMSLAYGGHLTHGSPFNRSGRQYKVIPYTVDLNTGKLDYAQIAALAMEHKPKIIVAGASAYPWSIDWARLKAIAEKVPVQVEGLNRTGAILMADISHPSGLVVAGFFPNPVGIADVSTLTTHKTLCGPRGAIILSTDEEIARRVDLGVFPGEQGGPHMNNIAAKAVCFKIAATKQFKQLQQRIYDNCQTLAKSFRDLDMKLAYGGTDSHLLLIDLDSIKTASGIPLRGDVASNILDLCGITCNKNALPGDETGARPRGIRFGTTVISQLGMGKPQMQAIAKLVYRVLTSIQTFTVTSHSGDVVRGKIDLQIMDQSRQEIRKLLGLKPEKPVNPRFTSANAIEITGERAVAFLQALVPDNLYRLQTGQVIKTVLNVNSKANNILLKKTGEESFVIAPVNTKMLDETAGYLKGLSDGYSKFDPADVYCKVEGPVVITLKNERTKEPKNNKGNDNSSVCKPYFIGQAEHIKQFNQLNPLTKEEFKFVPYEGELRPDAPVGTPLTLRKTALYEEHLKLTKPSFMVPFAGWSMPIWYTRASEEHLAVRTACGLFDVSHMGKIQVQGHYAMRFLDLVTSNYVPKLITGQSHYSYIFGPDGNVLDDLIVYYLSPDNYLLVVNASNFEKIYQWLIAVNDKTVMINRANPAAEVEDRVNISIPTWVNVALQGRKAMSVLRKIILTKPSPEADKTLGATAPFGPAAAGNTTQKLLRCLKKTNFIQVELGGLWAMIARTGYTGEELGYEIFVKRDDARTFWTMLLEQGKEFGIKACGLAARDSLRTEAGLPLYGHELEGEQKVTPTQAGYGAFIKRHKPFFAGRKPYIQSDALCSRSGIPQQREKNITHKIIRFKVTAERARALKPGDTILFSNEHIGTITSCTLVPAERERSPTGKEGMIYVQMGLALIDKKYAVEGTEITAIPKAGGDPIKARILGKYSPAVRL